MVPYVTQWREEGGIQYRVAKCWRCAKHRGVHCNVHEHLFLFNHAAFYEQTEGHCMMQIRKSNFVLLISVKDISRSLVYRHRPNCEIFPENSALSYCNVPLRQDILSSIWLLSIIIALQW